MVKNNEIKTKANTQCIPLVCIKSFEEGYPGFWKTFDETEKELQQRNILKKISSLDVTGETFIKMKLNFLLPEEQLSKEMVMAIALSKWRKTKEIFIFSDELREEIFSQPLPEKLPIEILNMMPFECIYLQEQFSFTHSQGIFVSNGGCFIYKEINRYGKQELYFVHLALYKDGEWDITCVSLPLFDCNNLEEIMQKYVEQCRSDSFEVPEGFKESMLSIVVPAIKMLLYLCAENAEIKPLNEIKRKKKIRDNIGEVRKWAVGEEYSNKIREWNSSPERKKYVYEENNEKVNTGRVVSPHMRRAHWQHFWTGKRNSDDRKLVLRWIDSIFVNKDIGESKKININKVE